MTPRHARWTDQPCARRHFRWPWWCSRDIAHDGPCALYWKPWKI